MFTDGHVATIVKLTPAADVYSLAKSAYVLITGESPRRFSNFPISELPDNVRQKPWANEFLRVLRRATQNNPEERPQSVNEFWQEISRVNFFALPEEADEPETQISKHRPHLVPQPSITPDYSPNAPLRPKFDTSRELKFKNETLEEPALPLVVKLNGNSNSELNQPSPKPISESKSGKPIVVDLAPAAVSSKGRLMRRSLIIALFLLTFAGGLFITQNYLRKSQFLPEFQNPFGKYPEGVAIQDINLRPTPGVEKPPVGLVLKGARVRITETKDNWIKIDIIESTRPENNGEEKSGWVNKRYIDLQE
jgi:serine/threonine protein kinase